MKIAVTSTGRTARDRVDPRFGRARYILIIDTETHEVEAIDNSANINAFKGAGIQAATLLCDRGVQILFTGYCGPNAFKALRAGGVNVVSDVTGSVGQAVDRFNSGEFNYLTEANTQGHW